MMNEYCPTLYILCILTLYIFCEYNDTFVYFQVLSGDIHPLCF